MDSKFAGLSCISLRWILLHFEVMEVEEERYFPKDVGSLRLLGAMPHVSLYNLFKKYGSILYLKLGTSGMVVASSPAAAKAFLKTLDTNFCNRPGNAGSKYMAYDSQDMVWSPYGDL